MRADSLPALLLGVLPARPAAGATPATGPELAFVDEAGRHWSATLDRGIVRAWSVGEADQPLWWWRRQTRGGILSQRQGRQLRWQEVVSEPLRGDLPSRRLPASYRESCQEVPPA